MRNELGRRGEWIFFTLLTRLFGRSNPIFRPQLLGEKWPTVDCIVELIGVEPNTPYFFVQIKSTTQGLTQGDYLQVQVSKDNMRKLALYPAPTYIAGIDEQNETGYIVSANGEWLEHLSTLSTRFPITRETQDQLWQEVRDFWRDFAAHPMESIFIDPRWRVSS